MVRARNLYDDFAHEPRLHGKVEITVLDRRWVCGEIDLKAEGRRVAGSFAAEWVTR